MKRRLENRKEIVIIKRRKTEASILKLEDFSLELLKIITKDFTYQELCHSLFRLSKYFLSLKEKGLSQLPAYSWSSNSSNLFLNHYGMYFTKLVLPKDNQKQIMIYPSSLQISRDEFIVSVNYSVSIFLEYWNYTLIQTSKKLVVLPKWRKYESYEICSYKNPSEIKNLILMEDSVFFTRAKKINLYMIDLNKLEKIKFEKDIDKLSKVTSGDLLYLSNKKLFKLSYGFRDPYCTLKELDLGLPKKEQIEDYQIINSTNKYHSNKQILLIKTNLSQWLIKLNLRSGEVFTKVICDVKQEIKQISLNQKKSLVLNHQNKLEIYNWKKFIFSPFNKIELKEEENFTKIGFASPKKSFVFTNHGRLFLINTYTGESEKEDNISGFKRLIFNENAFIVIFEKYFKIFSNSISILPLPENFDWEQIDRINCVKPLEQGFQHSTIFLKNTNQILIYSLVNKNKISKIFYQVNLLQPIINGDPKKTKITRLFNKNLSKIEDDFFVEFRKNNLYKSSTGSYYGKKIISNHLSQSIFRVSERKEAQESTKRAAIKPRRPFK